MGKTWHKPLYKRKVWKTMSKFRRTSYYLKPFIIHLISTWQQPLPFPTFLKILYSCFLILLILLPIISPIVIMITYYAIVQYLLESSLGLVYPTNLDILHYIIQIFNVEIQNESYIDLLNFHMDRWRYITTALISFVDYIRLALYLTMS